MLAVPLAVIALAAYVFLGRAPQGTVTNALIALVAVVAIGVFTGNSGVVSFGHVAFMGVAAHISALLTMSPALKASVLPDLPAALATVEIGFAASLVVTTALVSLFALAIGLAIARLGGAAAAIATLGVLIIVHTILVGARDFTRGSQALYGVPQAVDILVALPIAIAAIAVGRWYRDSMAGLELRASREDEPAAQSIGVDVATRRLGAWVLSAALASVAGVLVAHNLGVFSPREFYFTQTFMFLVMLIVGGMSTVSGAVIGTVLVTALVEVLRRVEEGPQILGIELPQVFGLTTIGLGVAIIVVLIWRREGLTGYREVDEYVPWRPQAAGAARGEAPADLDDPPAADAALAVDRLSKVFGGLVALDGASISLRPGEIVGLIGPNGSGKTTLLSCIAGAQPPTEGRVLIDGTDATVWPAHRVARAGVGRTFQNIRLFGNLTALDNVRVAMAAGGRVRQRAENTRRALALLADLGLADSAGRPAATLAYGQQRRLEIARALALAPRYLLLDEPAAGMNETESDALLTTLAGLRRHHGLGLLVVDHDLRLMMRLCDRIVVLNKGQVIATGAPAAVQTDPAVIEAYLGSRRAAGDDKTRAAGHGHRTGGVQT